MRSIPLITLIICSFFALVISDYSFDVENFFILRAFAVMCLCPTSIIFFLSATFICIIKKTTVSPINYNGVNKLITHGPFSFSRNPIYLSFLMMLASLLILINDFFSWFMFPSYYVYLLFIHVIPEEHFLSEKFGCDYLSYMKSTNRWLF